MWNFNCTYFPVLGDVIDEILKRDVYIDFIENSLILVNHSNII